MIVLLVKINVVNNLRKKSLTFGILMTSIGFLVGALLSYHGKVDTVLYDLWWPVSTVLSIGAPNFCSAPFL